MTTKRRKKTKHPDKEMLEQIEMMRAVSPISKRDIAAILNVKQPFLEQYFQTYPEYNEAYNAGRADARHKLAQALFDEAVNKRTASALIFLAKNELGMSDNPKLEDKLNDLEDLVKNMPSVMFTAKEEKDGGSTDTDSK